MKIEKKSLNIFTFLCAWCPRNELKKTIIYCKDLIEGVNSSERGRFKKCMKPDLTDNTSCGFECLPFGHEGRKNHRNAQNRTGKQLAQLAVVKERILRGIGGVELGHKATQGYI